MDLEIEDLDITRLEGQPARQLAGAENESETAHQLEEQPARSLVGAENEAKIFSRTTQNHAAMLSLQYIYNGIIRLAYSF